ncbi:MAG: DUF3793 family protein [Clostridia bacterium]|nr:DUF3793 family protein [Clostridia bacterium]
MSEEALVRNCAPTLAGLKTGNLFSYACDDRAGLGASVRALNGRLKEKGLRLLLLRCENGRALLTRTGLRNSTHWRSVVRHRAMRCSRRMNSSRCLLHAKAR